MVGQLVGCGLVAEVNSQQAKFGKLKNDWLLQ